MKRYAPTEKELALALEKATEHVKKWGGPPDMMAAYITAFIAGIEHKQGPEWIDVLEQAPLVGQTVAFVIKSREVYYNGRVLGGTYQGLHYGAHEFAVPGHGWEGTHWLPLPEAPHKC
jgi:hypothetical protein